MVQSGNRSLLRPKPKTGAQVIKGTLNASTFSAIISRPSLASEQELQVQVVHFVLAKAKALKKGRQGKLLQALESKLSALKQATNPRFYRSVVQEEQTPLLG